MPTRLFLRSTTTEPGTNSDSLIYDLSETQGSDGSVSNGAGNTTTWTEIFRWRKQVGADVSGTSFPVSVNITSVTSSTEQRYRIQRVNSGGAVQASSAYSSVFTGTGAKTATLTLDTTWASGDILQLSMEERRSGGHGDTTCTVNVSNTSSYVDATMTEPAAEGEAALSGAGNLSGTGIVLYEGTANLAGEGRLYGKALETFYGEANLAGSGVLTGDGLAMYYGLAALAGAGVLTATGTAVGLGAAAPAGAGGLTAAGETVSYGQAELEGTGVLTGSADVALLGEAALAGAGALGATGLAAAFGSASFAGEGRVQADGILPTPSQLARPVSTITNGGWQVPPLWSKVNETSQNDSPFIYSTDDTHCELALGSVMIPDEGDVIIHVRARRTLAGANLRVRLMEGSTERTSRELDSLTDSFATYPMLLTTQERDSISNWGDLRVRLARE